MKVLFLHANQPDYLAETLFHGLRTVLGIGCVDVPRYDSTYAPLSDSIRAKLRGHGFSVYGLLPDDPILVAKRFYWQRVPEKYDLYIIANIWWQYEQFLELTRLVPLEKIVVLDGIDAPECFPYAWRLHRSPWAWLAQIRSVRYFKRELMGDGLSFGLGRVLPEVLRKGWSSPKNTKPIAFSIPREKITLIRPETKTKDFNRDIVDLEVAEGRTGESYPFQNEAEYYADLQASRFGITTKRGGWDCLRHYEMAANGCVLAFRELDAKPSLCAPHGLDRKNCLVYRNKADLLQQIAALTPSAYEDLLQANYQWIEKNTTEARARQFLSACASC
jgi:hypothetical protein